MHCVSLPLYKKHLLERVRFIVTIQGGAFRFICVF
jgi:hypothetical protein